MQNGVEGSESLENSLKVEPEVEKRKKKKHTRSFSHTNRLSYMEAVSNVEMLPMIRAQCSADVSATYVEAVSGSCE